MNIYYVERVTKTDLYGEHFENDDPFELESIPLVGTFARLMYGVGIYAKRKDAIDAAMSVVNFEYHKSQYSYIHPGEDPMDAMRLARSDLITQDRVMITNSLTRNYVEVIIREEEVL